MIYVYFQPYCFTHFMLQYHTTICFYVCFHFIIQYFHIFFCSFADDMLFISHLISLKSLEEIFYLLFFVLLLYWGLRLFLSIDYYDENCKYMYAVINFDIFLFFYSFSILGHDILNNFIYYSSFI